MDAVVVDARGLTCPQPVILLARAAKAAGAGTEIMVLWTDPAARYDIAAWARMRGHRVTDVRALPATPQPATPQPATPQPDQVPPPPTPPAHSTTVLINAEWSGSVVLDD